jgi:hypothetical protein
VIRRGVAVACVVVLGALGVTACSDDDGSGSGGGTPRTTQLDDAPATGPQSGTNPAGDEPVPGSAPANG